MQGGAINRAVQEILTAKKTIVLIGAGTSVESGISDFRSEQEVWTK